MKTQQTKKKRPGRPPLKTTAVDEPKKKRGRPPKSPVAEEPKKKAPKEDKVFVVVTTSYDGEHETFADIVLITRNEEKAKKLTALLKKHKADIPWLNEYGTADYQSRDMERV